MSTWGRTRSSFWCQTGRIASSSFAILKAHSASVSFDVLLPECGRIDAGQNRPQQVAAIDQLQPLVELLVAGPADLQMLFADRLRQLPDRDIEDSRRPPEAFLQSAQPLAGQALVAKPSRLDDALHRQRVVHVAGEDFVAQREAFLRDHQADADLRPVAA
ncbi:MAG: hypothetical protein WCQ77_13150 [Planctomycetota bacterium]